MILTQPSVRFIFTCDVPDCGASWSGGPGETLQDCHKLAYGWRTDPSNQMLCPTHAKELLKRQ